MHKRVGAATTNGHPVVVPNGLSSPMPTRQQQRRRKKRVKSRPSQIVEDWMALVLGFFILIGCAYWIFAKIWLNASGSSDNVNYHYGSNPADDDHTQRQHDKGRRHKEGKSPMADLKPIPKNHIHPLEESHDLVGDRSDRYARLRKHYDELLPKDFERSLTYVQQLRENQLASDYSVVPIISHESHGSLHQQRHRNFGNNNGGEEEEAEEEEEGEEQIEEEKSEAELRKDEVYDIYNCPDDPVPGYPYAWPIMTVLDNWSPDNVEIPDVIYQGLCVFDYAKDFDKAMNYRNKEVPFIMQNDPEVARTVERWTYPGFMNDLLKGVKHRAEYSTNNHFMYSLPAQDVKRQARKHGRMWNKMPKDWKPPTEMLRMTYEEWLTKANITAPAIHHPGEEKHKPKQEESNSNEEEEVAGPDEEHWYFRLIGCGLTGPDGSCDKGSSEYLFDELPYFQPVNNLYLTKGSQQKGIHCRFGMKGVIAENHFDGSRNAIVLLGGSRRYILSHPDQCEPLSLFPNGHPSARHSQVDYTNPDLEKFPQFAQANVNEVILQPGDVLYLPTHWFHYIVSLELNFQCNTRSGIGYEYEEVMNECGF
ncbi:Hypoxia-inducible factor 1-alpha inhibitor [Seminavis robusta]|uniref:Hypoxia-inducible factor 1-alpha inhibitor n=1 Tax=Seminavis robusta TaxID=568900 RepID=A0A9N8DXV3_9STRA|nr:Hypoxia-inducible factor 1-alpha inhibitor [Seminavis robusta]|eukprot:Sro438_g142950.1 Hypoxia-inducible factor 1-alpha inhibitor (591) ;mRNA; r:8155-10142